MREQQIRLINCFPCSSSSSSNLQFPADSPSKGTPQNPARKPCKRHPYNSQTHSSRRHESWRDRYQTQKHQKLNKFYKYNICKVPLKIRLFKPLLEQSLSCCPKSSLLLAGEIEYLVLKQRSLSVMQNISRLQEKTSTASRRPTRR